MSERWSSPENFQEDMLYHCCVLYFQVSQISGLKVLAITEHDSQSSRVGGLTSNSYADDVYRGAFGKRGGIKEVLRVGTHDG